MKKILPLFVIAVFAVGAFNLSCKKASMKELTYADVNTSDWLQASVKKKTGESVLWFQIFDDLEDKSTVESYKSTSDKVAGYPAKIFKDKWIWLLVNNRMEIRLIADDKSKDFQSTDKLKEFIEAFDLSGMAKVSDKKKMKSEDMKEFMPKLGTK